MRILIGLLIIIIFGCAPKTTKTVVKETDLVKNPVMVTKSERIVFCEKIYDLREKMNFLNDVYRAFHWGDSSSLKAYLKGTVTINIQQGSGANNNFSDKSLSNTSLLNWTSFLTDLASPFGTSVCVKLDNHSAEFNKETCLSNQGVKGKAYLKFIHFEKIKGEYVLKGIGVTNF